MMNMGEQSKIENNEAPTPAPEQVEEKDISPQEFLTIANQEEQNFKQETADAINSLNSVDLDPQTFESIKQETGIEAELSNLDQEAANVIQDSKHQVDTTEPANEARYSVEYDPRFSQMLEKEAYFRLKTYDKDYFDKNFSGLSERGYLIDLDGKETMTTPSMNIGGKTGDLKYSEFMDITKQKFFHEYPDAKEKSDKQTALGESAKKEETNKVYENPVKEDKTEQKDTPEEQEKYENKEVSEAFKEAGMPLDWRLVSMLEESQEHQGGRRGSGFTQSSRYMADIIRSERSSKDFKIFDDSFRSDIEDGYFKNGDIDKLKTVDFRDFVDKDKLKEISSKIKGPGGKLLVGMIRDVFEPKDIDNTLTSLPASKEKMEIGTCTTAEVYFFDYVRGNQSYGKNFEDKSAKMNIFTDEKGEPLFMEKIGLGENHSAISLKDFYLNSVKIPAGSLVALQYDKPSEDKLTGSKNGNILDSKILQAVEFLRFTTLVVEPKDREQTFGEHLKWQKQQEISGAEDLTLSEVIAKCKKEISAQSN